MSKIKIKGDVEINTHQITDEDVRLLKMDCLLGSGGNLHHVLMKMSKELRDYQNALDDLITDIHNASEGLGSAQGYLAQRLRKAEKLVDNNE